MKLSPVQTQKYLLRLSARANAAGLTAKERAQKNRKIFQKVIKTSLFKKAKGLFIYVSLPDEVDTLELIARALRSGKQVFVPAVKKSTKEVRVFEITDVKNDLKPGSYGILEPVSRGKQLKAAIDLLIIPGVAFDRKGSRLGRGLGYFDRFLKAYRNFYKIGLAFREQMVAEIPGESHDVRLDQVITD